MSMADSVSNPPGATTVPLLRELYFELGRALSSYSRDADAAEAFEKALKEEGPIPESDVLLFNLAAACERGKQTDRAFRSYLEAIALAPQRMADILPSVHQLLTPELATAQGEWLDLEWKTQIKTESLASDLQAELARFLGRVSLYRGQYDVAAGFFERALAHTSDDPRVWEGLGEARWQLRDIPGAVKVLTSAHDLAGKSQFSDRLISINAKLARVLEADGQYQPALDRTADSLAKGDLFAGELLLIRSRCHLALGHPGEALEAAEAAKQRDAMSAEARLLCAQALIALGRCSDALKVVDEAAQIDPQRPEVLLYKAQALLEGQIDIRQARRVLARYPERAGADVVSPKTLPAMLVARKGDSNALYFMAELYHAVGYPDDAMSTVEQALKIGFGPETEYREAPAQQLKGELLEKSGQKTEAAKFLYDAGRRFLWRQEYDIAAEQLRRSAELDPKEPVTYWYWAESLRLLSYQPSLGLEEKKAAIEESAKVWDKSVEVRSPDQDQSWAYITRAWISEQKATMLATNLGQRRMWWWEGIMFLERELLLDERNEDAWISLSRYHRFLGNEANALQTTAVARNLNSESPAVQEERAATLANVGELQAAEEVIDERRAAAPNSWADGVKAYILAEQHKYKEAFELIDRVVEAEPDELWSLDLRARCLRMLGDRKRAEQDYKFILSRYDAKKFDDQVNFGVAAYYLGDFERAIKILSDSPELKDGTTSPWYLGACYLAQNKLVEGEQFLAQSVAQARNLREPDDTLNEDLPELSALSEGWPHGAKVRKIVQRIRQKAEARKTELKTGPTPESELKTALDKLALSWEEEGWAWIGIHAGLGRLHLAAGRYADAASSYRLLFKSRNNFPELGIATRKVAGGCSGEGDGLLKSDRSAEAIKQYRKGLDILSDDTPEGAALRAGIQARIGFGLFLESDRDNARSEFHKLLRMDRQPGAENPGQILGQTCRQLLNNPQQYWALHDEWEAYEAAVKDDVVLSNELAAARNALNGFVADWLEREMPDSNSDLRVPLVTPIVMEIGDGLVPADTGDSWSLFNTYIPEMRARFENQIGIPVPGVRVRGSKTLSKDGYTLMLDEHFLVGGNTCLEMRYSPAPITILEAAGVPTAALKSAKNPLTGEVGYWIPQQHWESLRAHNLELWAEPLVFVANHLETLLRLNLADFLGIQEVDHLLASWIKNEEDSALIQKVLADEQARLRFARLLRVLVREQAPIKAWKEIVASAQSTGLENLEDAVRAVRVRLKEQLPGNDSRTRRIELSEEWKSALLSWTKRSDGATTFGPPAEQVHPFLLALGDLLQSGESNAVLVVDCAESRPYVRRLIESRFPRLMVLSSEELLPQHKSTTPAA